MKQVVMYISDEFHEMLVTNMIGDEVLIAGMDFYFDNLRTEPLYSEAEGEDIPVLTCNAAFRAMAVGKGHSATDQIKLSDERADVLKKKAEEHPGWAFSELPGLTFMNINGEVVPTNEEARSALRTRTFPEIMFDLPKRSLTQQDYEEAELYFETRSGKKTSKIILSEKVS